MNQSKHSPETIERMKANAEAAKKRLSRLNNEYLVRQKAQKQTRSQTTTSAESFSQAVSRIAKEEQITL